MAALLDHADSDGLLRDSGLGFPDHAQHVGQHVDGRTARRFQKSRRKCTSSAALESSGDRVTAAPDGMSQTWSD